MRGQRVLMLCVGLSGCAHHVVHVETDPGAAKVTLNGNAARGDRWSVPRESGAEIVATWPDGRRLATAVVVDRDMRVVVRRDGDPSQVVGARTMMAAPTATPGPVTPEKATPSPEEADPMTRAKVLAGAGQKAYELTDYEEAITRFKQAYELIRGSKDPRAPEILGNILYNLAVVYERSHEVTPEVERLRRARVMYRQFDEQMASLVKGRGARRRPEPHPCARHPDRRQVRTDVIVAEFPRFFPRGENSRNVVARVRRTCSIVQRVAAEER